LRAQAEALKGQIESYEIETKELSTRTERDQAELAAARQQLAEERERSDTLGSRVTELERHLVAQTTEAEILGRRVQELVARAEQQTRTLSETRSASDALRQQAATAAKLEADVRGELAEAEQRRKISTEALLGEKKILDDQLRQAQDERAKLQQEIATMKRNAEAAWAAERMENAVLRERINDVAAEVARLTVTLEGPGSPIETILAEAGASPAAAADKTPNGKGKGAPAPAAPAAASNVEPAKGTLADRIRALQSRTSRVPAATRA
jgi:chromosome segregation ATPase